MDANSETRKHSFLAQMRLAIAFLTRLPVDLDSAEDDRSESAPATLAEAMWLFPLVGFAIGGTGAITLGLLAWAGVPASVAAALAIAAMVLLTGALHEDGLADIADGFGGGANKATKLSIMRDSRVGTYGVVTVTLVLIIKIAALSALAHISIGAAAGALIAAATWSRALFAPTMRWLEPARTDGLGANAGAPSEGTSWLGLLLAAALVTLVLLTPAGFGIVMVLAAGSLGAFAVGWIALKQIGGYTGDVLGAGQQVAEAAALIAASAVISGYFS